MKLLIVGGRLQALEAAYLAQSAGYETALMDRDAQAPARSLVQGFYPLDLLANSDASNSVLRQFDLVLPATEDPQTLMKLFEASRRSGVPMAFDEMAYQITSSKIRSNRFFQRIGIPMPAPWPDCGFPVMFKPSELSGSAGVTRADTETALKTLIESSPEEYVVQAFLDGPSYSLEVLGNRGECTAFQVVLLEFDAMYDCKRVLAGPETGVNVTVDLCILARRVCAAIELKGIMDIEVIQSGGRLKVLEIDARLPSQTPVTVFHSSDVNLLENMVDYWMNGRLPTDRGPVCAKRAVILEHFHFNDGRLEIAGEHVLARAQGLRIYRNLFGADVFISNFESSKDWAATALFVAADEAGVHEVHERSMNELQKCFKVETIFDPSPAL